MGDAHYNPSLHDQFVSAMDNNNKRALNARMLNARVGTVEAIYQGTRKPAVAAAWHPTTIPEYEAPFYLNYVAEKHEYFLTRHGDCRVLPCQLSLDVVRLGCTYIDNSAIREMYWWSNASPRWLRWLVRMWDGWRRRSN